MLIKKNPVLTGFHPDPTRLPCAKGAVSLLTEGLENRMEELC